MTLIIREADRDDAQVLCRLVHEMGGHEITPEQMEDRLNVVEASPFDSLYVCEEGGTDVGFFGFRVRENIEEVSRYGKISTIAVVPEARARGIGRFMMDYAEGASRGETLRGHVARERSGCLPPPAIVVLPGAAWCRVLRERLRGAGAHRGVPGRGPGGGVDRADPPPLRHGGAKGRRAHASLRSATTHPGGRGGRQIRTVLARHGGPAPRRVDRVP